MSECVQNMLTGMIASTSGTANINGYNINHEMDEIRQFLGVCPQHSLLWPMLTVYEHLYLFAILKNMERHRIDSQIEILLNDVGLFNKKRSYSSTLSGGQKRKLSLALAFIGDPTVIFLDEPTSFRVFSIFFVIFSNAYTTQGNGSCSTSKNMGFSREIQTKSVHCVDNT